MAYKSAPTHTSTQRFLTQNVDSRSCSLSYSSKAIVLPRGSMCIRTRQPNARDVPERFIRSDRRMNSEPGVSLHVMPEE